MSNSLPTREEDYSKWYNDLVVQAELADYSPVRGCMVIRPYGYAIWNRIKNALNERIEQSGVDEAYFPLFIPMSFFEREAEHVEGFSPELAVVTHGGGKELEEPLVVRPTSEAIIGDMFSKWIQSYRDLPLKINQWANVVRWEKRPRLFLRTLEFLWQEGHTAHSSYEEAQEMVEEILFNVYQDFCEQVAAIPVIPGKKSENEKFAGALATYTLEAMMGNTWALQAGTSHNLGQNFAKAFNIQYSDDNNELQDAWTTSWGMTSRMVGAVIMVHGDDHGLVLPPKLAPHQIVIVPIWRDEEQQEAVLAKCQELLGELGDFRVKLDDRDSYSPGFKFNEWEQKGVPVRLEIGPKDLEKGTVVVARRDMPGKQGKQFVSMETETLIPTLHNLLDEIQSSMLEKAREFQLSHTYEPKDYAELQDMIPEGWVHAYWCEDEACEAKVKEDTKATLRCLPFEEESEGTCIVCGKPATKKAVFARAY